MGSGDRRNKRRYAGKRNSEEISIPLSRTQVRNLEMKTILPMYLPHVPNLTTRYFLINRMTLKN